MSRQHSRDTDWSTEPWPEGMAKTPIGVSMWNWKGIEWTAAAHPLPGGQIRWPNTACSFVVSMIPKQKQNIVPTEKGEMLFFFWEMFSYVPALCAHSLVTLPTISATWMDGFPYLLAKYLETSSRQKLVEKKRFFRFLYSNRRCLESWTLSCKG